MVLFRGFRGKSRLPPPLSNMEEVRARGGQLYVFADSDSQVRAEEGVQVLKMPEHYGALSPILHVVALRLLTKDLSESSPFIVAFPVSIYSV